MERRHRYRALAERLISEGVIPPFVYMYPPRSSYRPFERPVVDASAIWQADSSLSAHDLNLYIHIPFCEYICGFCNLYKMRTPSEDVVEKYVAAVCTQLRAYQHVIRARTVRTVYIGGGTPTVLPIAQMEKIFSAIDDVCPGWASYAEEVCVEATPDSISGGKGYEMVRYLRGRGVTRVSVGVQSMIEVELKDAGRLRAGPSEVRSCFERLRSAGIPNVSSDLIMGFSRQTLESWRASVEGLLLCAPDTFSIYFLTIRPDAWFSSTGRYSYFRSPALYDWYEEARQRIIGSGYVQESNVRFKLAGRGGYRQKVLQFRGIPYLGIGLGARTYTNAADYVAHYQPEQGTSAIDDYLAMVKNTPRAAAAGYVLDDEERIRRRLALDLTDLHLSDLNQFQYATLAPMFDDVLGAIEDLGLVSHASQQRYQLTARGLKYKDIVSWLFASSRVRQLDRQFYANLAQANARRFKIVDE